MLSMLRIREAMMQAPALKQTGGYVRQYCTRLQNALTLLDEKACEKGIDLIHQAFMKGRQIITVGNGGSALTALHFITDWNKAIPEATGRPFKGRSLVDNVGLLTALANDTSYENVFELQLKEIANPGDLVIAISCSGNSP